MYTIQHEQIGNNGSFFIVNSNGRIAHLDYTENPKNVLSLTHTYVSNELRGQKIASRLVETSIAYAKENNLRLKPVCPYVITWFEQHPEEKVILASATPL